jgi:hypothetical protein
MTGADRDGGPIDPFSPFDFYDVLRGDIPAGESTEYLGFHLPSQGNGVVHIQPDGYAGSLGRLDADDYDDVLEVVAELNSHHVEWSNLQSHGDLEERVERAGKLMTSDPEKAEENPELYLHVPNDVGEEATA